MKAIIVVVFAGIIGLFVVIGFPPLNKGDANQVDPVAVRPGREASDFTIKLFSGDSFNLKEQRGKATLVNFWASWCPPCRDEAPVLERAWEAYKDRGVVFVGVDIWDNEPDALGFIKQYGITYPNGPDNGNIPIEYGVTGVPESWFLNNEGKLIRRWIGPLTDQQIKAFIEEALR